MYNETLILLSRQTVQPEKVTVLADGSDGKAAIVRVSGKLANIPFLDTFKVLLSDEYNFPAALDYVLEPGSPHVLIRFNLVNTKTDPVDFANKQYLGFFQGSRSQSFTEANAFAEKKGVPKTVFPTAEVFYQSMIQAMMQNAMAGEMANLGGAECKWYRGGQPYYNLWPEAIEPLTKIDRTKLRSTELVFPHDAMLFRLPHGEKRFMLQGHPVNGILTFIGPTTENTKTGCKHIFSMFFQRDHLVTGKQGQLSPAMSFSYVAVREDMDVDAGFDYIQGIFGSAFTHQEMQATLQMLSMVVGVSMMFREKSSILTPDVLSADRSKYEEKWDDKYVEKANRRGKFGWDVGRYGCRWQTE